MNLATSPRLAERSLQPQEERRDVRKGGNWICCQIGAREHYSAPRALLRVERLAMLITDFWVGPHHPLAMCSRKLAERYDPELAGARIRAPNLASLVHEFGDRLTNRTGWSAIMARNEWFQTMAIAQLQRARLEGPQTVFAYSYAARKIFRFARERGWRTVLGQIDPGIEEERIVERLYADEFDVHGKFTPAPAEYWRDWKEECALADTIVVNSRWSRDALMTQGVSQDKIRVLPLAYYPPESATNFDRVYPERFDRKRPMRVLFLGQVNLRKGIGPFVEAIRLLKDEPIEFWIVGPLQIEFPQDLLNGDQVRLIGAVPRGTTHDYYRDADLFLFPTFSDGFGLTQLEAQAWKLPVVASRHCGDVIEDGVNGVLLPEVTAPAIATVLRSFVRNPDRLRAISAASHVARRFSLDAFAEGLLDI